MPEVKPPSELVAAFASLDEARLTRSEQHVRAEQLHARQVLQDYIDGLWQDVQRSGERPDVGEKYLALALVRELSRSLTTVAFDAVYGRDR